MSQQSTEIQLALLVQWRDTVEARIKETDDAVMALQDERTKALKWGIVTLGTAVLAMASWTWNFVVGHLK